MIFNRSISRRRFLATSAAAAALLPTVTRNVLGANEKLNIAGIGAGGKGAVDIPMCSSENIIALCDVDQNNAAGMFKRFDKAAKYIDFRDMLDKEKSIDGVTISTPDHLHAAAAMHAMKRGKHVYCQKPLTHSIPEARLLTKTARDMKVCTQMGNQGHANNDTRRLVELIQAGVLGNVTQVHIWTDRAGLIWPQGQRAMDAFTAGKDAKAPSHVNFDLWLGPRSDRPYNAAYLPFKWRGFWDFGTGALGDMGCHNMDLAFWSLNLRDPVAASAQSSDNFKICGPEWAIASIDFPARGKQVACKLTWYEAGKKPDPALAKLKDLPRNGTLMVGDKDTLYVPHYWGAGQFLSGAKMEDFSAIPITLPRHQGNTSKNDSHMELMHHMEWINAIKASKPELAMSNFDYAGPMTEGVLMGNLAIRAGQPIKWDAKNMRVTNEEKLNDLVHDEYRKGWELTTAV